MLYLTWLQRSNEILWYSDAIAFVLKLKLHSTLLFWIWIVWAPRRDNLKKKGMPVDVPSARYPLVKGERITHSVLSSRLCESSRSSRGLHNNLLRKLFNPKYNGQWELQSHPTMQWPFLCLGLIHTRYHNMSRGLSALWLRAISWSLIHYLHGGKKLFWELMRSTYICGFKV